MDETNEVGGWVIDPSNPNRATYTDEDNVVHEIFRKEPKPLRETKPERQPVERLIDSFKEAGQSGFPGLVARKWYDWSDSYKPQLRQMYPDKSEEWLEEKLDTIISTAQSGLKQEIQDKQNEDPTWKPDQSFLSNILSVDRWAPYIAGQVLGSAGPESVINPGSTALARVGSQAALGGASDGLYQGLEVLDEVKKDFSVEQMLGSAAAGAGLQGAFEVPGFVKNLFKNRGSDTTPSANPLKPEQSVNPTLTPEEQIELGELYKTGTIDELNSYFNDRPALFVDREALKTFVSRRDKGDVTDTSVRTESDEVEPAQPGVIVDRSFEGAVPLEVTVTNPTEVVKNSSNQKGYSPSENVDDAVTYINELTRDWKNSPAFQVAEDFSKLDDPSFGGVVNESAIGVYLPDGTVMINLKNVDSPETLSAVTFHEGLGHFSLENKFRDDLDAVLEDIYLNSKGSFRQEVDQWRKENPNYYPQNTPNKRAREVEEVLAKMSEAGRVESSVFDRLRNYIKDFGRKLGLDLKYSDREIRTILSMSHSAMINGKIFAGDNGFSFPKFMKESSTAPARIERVGSVNTAKIDTVNDIDELLYELNAVTPEKSTITFEETEQAAKALGLSPSRIARRAGLGDPGKLTAYIRAANTALSNQFEKVADIQSRINNEGYSERLHEQALTEFSRLKAVHARVNGDNSELGRALSILRKVAESKKKSESVSKLLESLDNNILSNPEQFMKFMKLLNEQTSSGATKLISQVFKPKAEEYIFRPYFNMLLSSPATHVANFTGTAGNFIVDLLESTGAAIVGQGKRFSNAERIRGREVAYRVWGAMQALKDAQTWTNARESLNTGLIAGETPDKLGSSNVYTGDSSLKGFASGFLEAPTRVLAGTDEWWRNVLQLSNIYGLAVRNAGNKGLKGKQFWEQVDELINNPTTEMLDATNDYTKVLQFLDKPSLIAKTIKGLQSPKLDDGGLTRTAKGVLKFAVPFVNTPDALIRTAIRRSPLGFERENIEGWKKGGAERDKVLARLTMASMLSFYIATQAYKGNITGEGPSDYKKKAAWLSSNQPNSIKVGDSFYSIAGLEPVSTIFNAVSTLVERSKTQELALSEEDYLGSVTSIVHSLAAVLSENAYLEGLSSLFEISSSDSGKAEKAFENFAASLAASASTPAIIRKYAQTIDPVLRDTTEDGSLAGRIYGRVISGLPGLTQKLPQKYDTFGRPQSRDILGLDMASRVNTKQENIDPVLIELDRLEELTKTPIVSAPSKSNIKVKGVEKDLTSKEFQRYQYLSGYWLVESVRESMSSPDWSYMSDEEKIKEVQDIKEFVRAEARSYLFE